MAYETLISNLIAQNDSIILQTKFQAGQAHFIITSLDSKEDKEDIAVYFNEIRSVVAK